MLHYTGDRDDVMILEIYLIIFMLSNSNLLCAKLRQLAPAFKALNKDSHRSYFKVS